MAYLRKVLLVAMLLPQLLVANKFQPYNKQGKWFSLDQHLELGLGGAVCKLRDEHTSPLTYKGPAGMLDIAYWIQGQRFATSLDFNMAVGGLNNSVENGDQQAMFNMYFDINAQFGWKVYEENNISVFPGVKLQYMSNQWVNASYFNSAFQFNQSFLIGLNFYAERPIYFRGKIREFDGEMYEMIPNLKISWDLSLPFTGITAIPPYALGDITDPDASLIQSDSNIYISSIGQGLFVLDSKINADWYLKNGNALRLSYWWRFNQFKVTEFKTQYAIHGVSLAILFRTDRKRKSKIPVTER
ncbi:MAG: hypothetical protein MI922_26465 [Bacteroidales bacterium]|nr:hypothetical protein [Bacteroidales bacterium]